MIRFVVCSQPSSGGDGKHKPGFSLLYSVMRAEPRDSVLQQEVEDLEDQVFFLVLALAS